MRRSAPYRFGSLRVHPPPVAPGLRIGLLGGSFNPPHEGHLQISRIALKRLGLDRVWWLVTPGNPLKSHGELSSLADRVAACRAMADDRRIVITTFERELGTSFTAATLAFLRLRHPATRFVWLMGADNLAGFHRWQHWQGIFHRLPLAVIDRPGAHLGSLSSRAAHLFQRSRLPEGRAQLLADAPPPAWTFLSGRLSPLSSSEIRRKREW